MNATVVGAGAVLSAVLGMAALRACRFVRAVQRAHRLCDACAFASAPSVPQATRRILLVGDSTAVGIGASAPCETLAGQLVARFPTTAVENHGRVGARGADLDAQLARAAAPVYDAVLIAIGGNDILRGTRPGAFQRALDAAIRTACGLSAEVIVVNCPNVGGAPLFPWPLTAMLSRRSLRCRAAFQDVCARHPVEFVNFTYEAGSDPFRRRRSVYFAADGLHPSAAAYRMCVERLQAETRLSTVLG